MSKLIFEKSVPGARAFSLPPCDLPEPGEMPDSFLREEDALLPEVSEVEVVRHYTELSTEGPTGSITASTPWDPAR